MNISPAEAGLGGFTTDGNTIRGWGLIKIGIEILYRG
jgi:hypothetical protein